MTSIARRNIPLVSRAPGLILDKRLFLGLPLLLDFAARDRFRQSRMQLSPAFTDAVQLISDYVIL